MSKPASSGIQTTADGQAVIPSSRRADGSTRKEIKIRPGYKPPEDVETYKNRNAEHWRTRGDRVPGAETSNVEENHEEAKSKNAKRREAARRKKEQETEETSGNLDKFVNTLNLQDCSIVVSPDAQASTASNGVDEDMERQKKIRNHLKKLRAVRELKSKKAAGEKLSADQLVKISKEHEIIRDLTKLNYDGPELGELTDVGSVQIHPD